MKEKREGGREGGKRRIEFESRANQKNKNKSNF
jgi:hypothetical protein